MATYAAYIIISAGIIWVLRKDLLSPMAFFILAGFLAFGMSIPLLLTGNRRVQTNSFIYFDITEDNVYKALIIFFVATAGFFLGGITRLHKYTPFNFLVKTNYPGRKANVLTYSALALTVIIAGLIRIHFHLGEAGIQSSIPYAGYLQFILYDGVFLLSIWFLAQSLRQDRFYVVLGISLLLGLAITQALLGWRGGVIRSIYATIVLFWYQNDFSLRRKTHSLFWIFGLCLVASTIIQLGNEVRAERLGGEKNFAENPIELIEKIAYRSQGTTRLARVADHFGDLTLFNDFYIEELLKKGISTTEYIDRALYGVAATQSHSVGTSGPGGPYTALGLGGVFAAYFFLGIFYQAVYRSIIFHKNRENIFSVTLYAYLIFMLSSLLSENFGINFLKTIVAVLVQIFIFKIFLTKKSSPNPTPNPMQDDSPSIRLCVSNEKIN